MYPSNHQFAFNSTLKLSSWQVLFFFHWHVFYLLCCFQLNNLVFFNTLDTVLYSTFQDHFFFPSESSEFCLGQIVVEYSCLHLMKCVFFSHALLLLFLIMFLFSDNVFINNAQCTGYKKHQAQRLKSINSLDISTLKYFVPINHEMERQIFAQTA